MTNEYNLFIDDQINDWDDENQRNIRDPKFIDPTRNYIAVESVEKAIEYIENHGCPIFISFDFDLGRDSSGKIQQSSLLAKWLVKKDMDSNKMFIPENFSYQVHSANVEAKNNLSLLGNWLKTRESWIKEHDDDAWSY